MPKEPAGPLRDCGEGEERTQIGLKCRAVIRAVGGDAHEGKRIPSRRLFVESLTIGNAGDQRMKREFRGIRVEFAENRDGARFP